MDLLEIGRQEDKGNVYEHLNSLFDKSDAKIDGFPDAVIWKGGRFDDSVNPITHAFTDKFALVGTVSAIDVLGLPFHAIPMMAQYRHDLKLAPLSWLGNMPGTIIKWSTAGDAMVNDNGKQVVVAGKSGNAALRRAAGVFCNVRPYGTATCVRCMPCLPYSQDKKAFSVSNDGTVHSEMNTPGVQIAYACRHFLKMLNETGKLGRVALKPTQAQEDVIIAGLLYWLLKDTKFDVKKQYVVNPYNEQKENIDKIISLLPKDFKAGMKDWKGEIYMHIADTNYGILLLDMIDQTDVIILSTDLDGDRITDLMADSPNVLRNMCKKVLEHKGHKDDTWDLWKEMGYKTTDGRDMTSTMFRMTGEPIFEQTLGSADSMLDRLLAGKEGNPYNPRIHYVLMRNAYKEANPNNKKLHDWLDQMIVTFDKVNESKPSFLEGYKKLKEAIKPW